MDFDGAPAGELSAASSLVRFDPLDFVFVSGLSGVAVAAVAAADAPGARYCLYSATINLASACATSGPQNSVRSDVMSVSDRPLASRRTRSYSKREEGTTAEEEEWLIVGEEEKRREPPGTASREREEACCNAVSGVRERRCAWFIVVVIPAVIKAT